MKPHVKVEPIPVELPSSGPGYDSPMTPPAQNLKSRLFDVLGQWPGPYGFSNKLRALGHNVPAALHVMITDFCITKGINIDAEIQLSDVCVSRLRRQLGKFDVPTIEASPCIKEFYVGRDNPFSTYQLARRALEGQKLEDAHRLNVVADESIFLRKSFFEKMLAIAA